MSTFTEAQQRAITASGNVLVSAGAGTGKTRTVVARCLRLIGEGVSLENILMVTFTEAAAAEMRARLRKELERRRDAVIDEPGRATLSSARRAAGSNAAQFSGDARRAEDSVALPTARHFNSEDSLAARKRPKHSGVSDAKSNQLFLFASTEDEDGLPSTVLAEAPRLNLMSLDRIEEQLALLDTAHISTLHSFCAQLVRDHFHELHIDPQVTVLDEAQTRPLMHGTMQALFDRAYRGELGFAAGVQQLIRQYGGGSDEGIRALVIKLHRHSQSLPPSARWYQRELAQLETDDPTHWRAWLRSAFAEWMMEWRFELERGAECENIAACVRALAQCGTNPTPDEMRTALHCVVTVDKRAEWKHGDKGRFSAPLEKFFEEASFLRSLVEPRDGRDPLVDDWNWMRAPVRALLLLAQQFTEEFAQAKRALGGVDFADLEQLSLRLLLDDQGNPTEIAHAWQAKFAHVFVDECQDINAAQDAIICAVSRGSASLAPQRGEGSQGIQPHSGNRFLVGDVKQSIYRFRLADPTIFRRYEEAWRGGDGGQRIPLADNFRSREGILNFINSFFTALMRPAIGGVGYDEDARLRFGNPGERAPLSIAAQPNPRVELHVIHKVGAADGGEREDNAALDEADGEAVAQVPIEDVLAIEKEARLVARQLRELRDSGHEIWDDERQTMRSVEWHDMAVLLRSPSSRVETFAKEFSRAGVPLAAARAGFFSAIEVLDLLNLLRLLDNPLQDIPLVAVLRSPLAGLSVDELAAIRIESEGRTPFFAAVNRMRVKSSANGETEFSESARAKLNEFFHRFSRWRALARQTSLSHCLETVLAETHYEALLLAGARGRERVANVNRLLELARQYDPFQRQGLYRFLRFVAEQEEAELDHEAAVLETTHAVRLMSIHKSKGLEFPVVVVACLAAQFNTQDLREDILLNADYGLCAKIIPPHIERRYPSLAWWLARRRETRELLAEEMRLLYVAMTRARDTLLLTAFDKSKDAGGRWHNGPSDLGDRAVLKSQSYFGWLRRWLGANSGDANWSSEREGATESLRWKLQPERELGPPPPPVISPTGAPASRAAGVVARETVTAEGGSSTKVFDLDAVRARLTWKYPFEPATKETAKTNVSVLRRRATEEDEEARQLFTQRRRVRRDGTLTAAEIGTAHHLFMQRTMFERTGSVLDLRNQAGRLVQEGFLTPAEAAALDYDALFAFWTSEFGRRVAAAPHLVHRELPFTARFSIGELRALGFNCGEAAPDEFVVVQGIVDLAVIGGDGIEILDFKTDRVRAGEAPEKAAAYTPQIRLYAAALRAIYNRPVRRASLHFLATGETLPIVP